MAQPARRPIPETIQADVLVESRRRCAFCFHLHDDLAVKPGQIAHIDRDRANADSANLVFLCFAHHDQYDSRSSQAKGLLPEELRRAKRALEKAISDGRHRADPPPAKRGRETDRKALEKLQATMAIPLRFLRGVSFAGRSFVNWELMGLDEVAGRDTGADQEFIDCDLEALRKELVQAVEAFLAVVYRHTRRVPYNDNCRAVPRAWEQEEPERFQEAVTVLDTAAVDVYNTYDALVRLGRGRLLP